MARTPRPWFWKERDGWFISLNGKRIPLAKGKANKKLAEARFHELMLELRANPAPGSDQPTVVSIIENYLAHAERRLEARNYAEQRAVLQRFAEAHGYRRVADCKPFDLTRWLDANPAWKADWTLHRIVATVKRPFDWAVGQGLVAANPFRSVNHRPGAPRRPITDAEFQAMLRGAPGRRGRPFRQVLIFLRFTGCRPGEMAALKWDAIDLDGGVIVLDRHKTARKVRKPRLVPLVPVVVKLLIHLRRTSEGEFVFRNDRGHAWHRSALSLRIQRCRRRQGISPAATLYGVRHRFGTAAIVRGVDIKTLSLLLGHATTRMTEYYVHLSGEREHLVESMRRATARRPGA
jgi:integrase/recombinase XerD